MKQYLTRTNEWDTLWATELDCVEAWKSMMWYLTGWKPYATSTIRGACNVDGEFLGYQLLEKINQKNLRTTVFEK